MLDFEKDPLCEELLQLFKAVQQTLFQRNASRVEAFNASIKILASYVGIALRVRMERNMAFNQNSEELLAALVKQVKARIPCAATFRFGSREVTCDNIASRHTEHSSMETRPSTEEHHKHRRVRRFLSRLVPPALTEDACKWPGEFVPIQCQDIDATFRHVLDSTHNMQPTADFRRHWLKHNRFDTIPPTLKVCFGCGLATPARQLFCKHLLCDMCCDEFIVRDGGIQCPLCSAVSPVHRVSFPLTANMRVLHLIDSLTNFDAQINCLVAFEECLKAKCPETRFTDMFDYVILSGAGCSSTCMVGLIKGLSWRETQGLFHKSQESDLQVLGNELSGRYFFDCIPSPRLEVRCFGAVPYRSYNGSALSVDPDESLFTIADIYNKMCNEGIYATKVNRWVSPIFSNATPYIAFTAYLGKKLFDPIVRHFSYTKAGSAVDCYLHSYDLFGKGIVSILFFLFFYQTILLTWSSSRASLCKFVCFQLLYYSEIVAYH